MEAIDHIENSDFARIELLIFNVEAQQAEELQPARQSVIPRTFDILRDSKRRKRLLYSLYSQWDRQRIAARDDPGAMTDCSARFAGIESLRVVPVRKRSVHRFPPDAIERIREKELDVLIRFGFHILRGEILTAAKFGVWSYHHGDNDYYRGGPAHFWELYEGNPVSGVVLQVLTEHLDAGKVLYKGYFATQPGFSQAVNRVQPYWGSSTFLIQKLRELHQDGWEHIEQNVVKPAPYQGKKKIYTIPSNWEMVRWLGPKLVRKSMQRLVRRPAIPHWSLAIRSGGQSIVNQVAGGALDLSGFQWIESPAGRFYADPFLMEAENSVWLFFEDYDYAAQRGRVCCAEIRDGVVGEPRPVLDKPYHLSYPCVFRDGERLYMIPDTGSNGTVELYRCNRFPDVWEIEKVLFRARAVDTTIWIADGRYWFFVTLQEPRGNATQLWLFHASALTGEWISHPANPLSTDIRNSRGAGAMFVHQGRLFRPSQDCSKRYGYSFTLNEIAVLDAFRYSERPAVIVEPSWARGVVATHTYSRTAQIEVIDGRRPLPMKRVLGRRN